MKNFGLNRMAPIGGPKICVLLAVRFEALSKIFLKSAVILGLFYETVNLLYGINWTAGLELVLDPPRGNSVNGWERWYLVITDTTMKYFLCVWQRQEFWSQRQLWRGGVIFLQRTGAPLQIKQWEINDCAIFFCSKMTAMTRKTDSMKLSKWALFYILLRR